MLLTQLGRGSKLVVVLSSALAFLIVLHLANLSLLPQWRSRRLAASPGQDTPQKAMPEAQSASSGQHPANLVARPSCASLPGGDDVLVVMRTGATEIKDKLPVHLNTTFKCYQNSVIFSDYEEEFLGHKIYDVLQQIPHRIKDTNEDFKHYLHIQKAGRQNLDDKELSGEVADESGPIGKTDNAGWRLDKWKFLPMVNQTLSLYPKIKWFVFVEPDTYLIWSNLLQWLPHLDPSEALYYGSEVQIGDDVFAHGGSGFLLSNPAMQKAADIYNAKADEWHAWTAGHWAGDCVLGKALEDAGIQLSWAWPMFQGGEPALDGRWLDVKEDKTQWCAPALSYHHMVPSQIQDYWYFEQDWIKQASAPALEGRAALGFWHKDNSKLLHHRDTFKSYVLPNITSERPSWSNAAETLHESTTDLSLESCRNICAQIATCLQYNLGPQGCSTGVNLKMGREEFDVKSGWMLDRVQIWMNELDKHCSGLTGPRDGWTAP